MNVRRRNWRWAGLVREAAKNAVDWRSRQLIVLVTAVVVGLAVSLFSAMEWVSLQRDLDTLRDNGRNIVVFNSTDINNPASIDIGSCEALGDQAGVVRSGARIALGTVDSRQLGPGVPLFSASTTLFPDLNEHTILVGSALGLPAGTANVEVLDGAGNSTVSAGFVLDTEPQGLEANGAIIERLPPGVETTELCVVELDRFASVHDMIPTLAASLESGGGEFSGNAAMNETFDTVAAYLARPSRFLPVLAGLVGALLASVMLVMRSSELAAYRLSGTSRAALAQLLMLEQLLTSGVLVAFGSLGLLLCGLAGRLPPVDDFVWIWLAGLSWGVTFGVSALVGTRRNPADLARDR